MHSTYSAVVRYLAARLAVLLCGAALAACGGGGSGSNSNSGGGVTPPPPPPPAALACGPEPVPAGSAWSYSPGFPTCYDSGAGTFPGGAQNAVVVGNVDSNPDLEILVAGTAVAGEQSLFVFKADGSELAGWPPPGFPTGTAPFVLARLTNATAGDAIFAGTMMSNIPGMGENFLTAATADSGILTGWPRSAANFVGSYPAAFDADGDGIDELFTDEESNAIHAYLANGETLPGWPVETTAGACGGNGGQQVVSFAFGDIDQDTETEVVAVGRDFFDLTTTSCLLALNMDGSLVNGFPVIVSQTRDDPTVTMGDVDGDGALEIIYILDDPDPSVAEEDAVVLVISGDGVLERSIQLTGQLLFDAPASSLADLDSDGAPEIIVLTEDSLNVVRGDGTSYPGFPATFYTGAKGSGPTKESCSVVVGDIDGDMSPDLVFCYRDAGGEAKLLAYDSSGNPLPDTPLLLDRSGSLPRGPAIADIDLDGQNEVIVASLEGLFVFRYGNVNPSGPVLWGQWGNTAKHTNSYP